MKRVRTSQTGTGRSGQSGVYGSGVKNLQGRNVGVITDVVVDCASTKVVYVLIDIDTKFAGVAAARLLVPWGSLRLNLDTGDRATPYLLKITASQLRRVSPVDPLTFMNLAASEASEVSCSSADGSAAPLWCVSTFDSTDAQRTV